MAQMGNKRGRPRAGGADLQEFKEMQTQNRILDDLAKMASGAMSGLSGLRHEIEMRAREQIERILGRMDLVQREEFEAVKAMAAKAREEQELLTERLAELEKQLKTARK
jgi:BMFP domain-containing protein YqiC